MSVRLQFNRIEPGVEIGPHRHGLESIVYIAGGELIFEHGRELERRVSIGPGDVLYEAPAEFHLVRNEGTADVLALIATADLDPGRPELLERRWEVAHEPVRRREEAFIAPAGDVTRRLIVEPGDFGTVTFTVTEIEVAPGGVIDWHRHPGAEHAIVVFEGRGEIAVGSIVETLEPLKGIRIQPGQAHRIANTGRLPLRYYVCGTPATSILEDRESVEAPPRPLDAGSG